MKKKDLMNMSPEEVLKLTEKEKNKVRKEMTKSYEKNWKAEQKKNKFNIAKEMFNNLKNAEGKEIEVTYSASGTICEPVKGVLKAVRPFINIEIESMHIPFIGNRVAINLVSEKKEDGTYEEIFRNNTTLCFNGTIFEDRYFYALEELYGKKYADKNRKEYLEKEKKADKNRKEYLEKEKKA